MRRAVNVYNPTEAAEMPTAQKSRPARPAEHTETLDELMARVEPTRTEMDAVRAASEAVPEKLRALPRGSYRGVNYGALGVLSEALYGCGPEEMTPVQSRRTDGLLRLAGKMAEEGS